VQREKSRKLRSRFGPEYDRTLDREQSTQRAEAILAERQKRVEKFNIRRLTAEERDLFATKWRTAQEHFVDAPHDAVAQADALVTDVMRTRGYPMGDFEQRAADLSVDHPMVVSNYRTAHEIALRDVEGAASTEDLRKAMQHYRQLFEHLLDTRVLQHH
jgi:hypothetical protein